MPLDVFDGPAAFMQRGFEPSFATAITFPYPSSKKNGP